jgi:hypothetical protein
LSDSFGPLCPRILLRIEDIGERLPVSFQALTSVSNRLYKGLQSVSAIGFLPLEFSGFCEVAGTAAKEVAGFS